LVVKTKAKAIITMTMEGKANATVKIRKMQK